MVKKGARWRPVQASSLSASSRELYRQYVQKLQGANALGKELKEAVTREWNDKFPDGINNGEVCAFNALNGVLQYVMKHQKKTRTVAKKVFDEDSGDNVFGSPPAEPRKTDESGSDELKKKLESMGFVTVKPQGKMAEKIAAERAKIAAAKHQGK